jgi:glycerophosphoryl diester phosphodiesterase
VKKKWVLIAAIAGSATVLAAAAVRKDGRQVLRGDWPVNLAHRGASARAPENTLEAFRLAVEAGAGGLELDVHVSRDGEVVVIHDASVDRTTDGSGAVAEMELEEIRRLDAGYRFSPDGGRTFPYRGRGVTIPTLAEVYASFPEARVNADIKKAQSGAEEAVLRVIRSAGAEERTLIASTEHAVVRRFRRISRGHIATAASRREIAAFYVLSRVRLGALARPVYDALQVPVEHRGIELVTPRFLRAARSTGVRVDVWTINDAAQMRWLLDLGVSGIMTDHPEVLAALLAGRQ